MKELFSLADDVVLANPFGPAVLGWPAASQRLGEGPEPGGDGVQHEVGGDGYTQGEQQSSPGFAYPAHIALASTPQRQDHQTDKQRQSAQAEEPGVPVVQVVSPDERRARAHEAE